MRVVLVHNKTAGDGEHSRRRLVELIERGGHEVRWFSKGDHSWRSAVDASVELVAVAGGDGTVGTVVRALSGSRVPIAILPLGTANNISTVLGLTGVPFPELVAGWSTDAVRRIDVGVARGPWGTLRFIESVGVGLLADGMADIDDGRVRPVNDIEDTEARLTTATDVLRRMLTSIEASPFHVTLDGEPLPGHYLFVEILNLGTAGPNLRFAPHADPSDGLFDVVLADEGRRRELIEQLPTYRLDPPGAPALTARRARHVILRCGPFRVHVDDEVCDASCDPSEEPHIELTLEPGAIRFLVPDNPTPS
jgi:diacylglycerol kinase (ATP)